MLNTSLSQRRVVSRETSFHEQFLDVPIRKREPQIPTHRVNNDPGFEMPPFEQRWPRFDHGIFCSLSDSFTELFATQPSISKILGVIGVSSIKSAVCERCLVFGLLPVDGELQNWPKPTWGKCGVTMLQRATAGWFFKRDLEFAMATISYIRDREQRS